MNILRQYGAHGASLNLLRAVSRSFYITIRVLPRPLREPISLAYLLARATDTLADSTQLPPENRLDLLRRLRRAISGRPGEAEASAQGIAQLATDLEPAIKAQRRIHEGEAKLLEELPHLLDWLAALEPEDAAEVRAVLGTISQGQILDIERFEIYGRPVSRMETPAVKPLANAAELEDYTYRVAGCVGEFWTRLCLRHLPRYASGSPELLLQRAVAFGKGLQLVNILRDFPGDLAQGRCYLPADELSAAGVADVSQLAEHSGFAAPVWQTWIEHAREYLAQGAEYTLSLRRLRLRFACALPIVMGYATLAAAETRYALGDTATQLPRAVKVPRETVRRLMRRVLLAVPRRGALRRVLLSSAK